MIAPSATNDAGPGDPDPHRLARIGAARLSRLAGRLRDAGHANRISYSRKVFIPLTRLCRDVCHYCTFAHPPRRGEAAFLTPDQVLDIARAGARAGCREALFTLGDKPELRYRAARAALDRLGHASTISYLAAMCELVTAETGLLAHANPGVVDADGIALLRRVTVSQGIMLESTAERLSAPGGPHHGSPDKHPAARLAMIAQAGRQSVPFTTGILIGIGETRAERIDALVALADLNRRYGHIQEIIVQNFRAKPGTRMAEAAEPPLGELVWTIAAARLILGPEMNIQAPPNLSPGAYRRLVQAGLSDWGGISPVTPDHVNPEAPWPHIAELARQTADAGKILVERLAVYPAFARDCRRWQEPAMATAVMRNCDSEGYARTDPWSPGLDTPAPALAAGSGAGGADPRIGRIARRAADGEALSGPDIATLFSARGGDFELVCRTADDLRRGLVGDRIGYVVNRNINYTNICTYRCSFCAFSKGRRARRAGDPPYLLDLAEIAGRAREAWARGATEVCLQGGIHPEFTGETYLAICRAVREAAPQIHIHAFSPLEVWHGATTLGLTVAAFLGRLREAGLGSLPGTAAEILHDDVRALICPDKLTTARWLDVVAAAHEEGMPTTATIMFGHVDDYTHWAAHLLAIRELQRQTGGLTEFVALPFVHMEAPVYLKGLARRGPTFREAVLMHAVARLALAPAIGNIQTSWVKMGADGALACLAAGANDLGGTLMNESITRAAGAGHGQELGPTRMTELIERIGRAPYQRTTLYRQAPGERLLAARSAAPLAGRGLAGHGCRAAGAPAAGGVAA